jgi:cytochrome c oxidase subunit II
MRFKQDAVPGLAIHMHFTPPKLGEFEIAAPNCAGSATTRCTAYVKVVSQDEFDKWLAAREAEKQ